MKLTIVNFVPAIIWAIIIFILLVMPGSDIPANDFFELIYFDKWVHFGLFAVLTLFLCYPFIQLQKTVIKGYFYMPFLSAGYGIMMEFVQKYFTTTRTFDVTDIIADTAGVVCAIVLLRKISRNKSKGYLKK